MKNKIYTLLSKPYAVVLTMFIAPLFGLIDRNFSFFFGLGIVFLILWSTNFRWSIFGFGEKITAKKTLKSFLIALLFVFVFYIIEGFLEIYFGRTDLSSFDDIRNNIVGYIIMTVVIWVFAAFGEELLFRGYYMKHLAQLLGNTNYAWLASAIIVSIYFGLSHSYQGLAGIIGVGLWHFAVSLVFYKKRNDLISPILIHGFYDMIGLTLLFFSKERIFADWILQMFQV
ncbi:CPBP family intramembrane glutamic endopeptidase [Aquimarina rhabdastrellae]